MWWWISEECYLFALVQSIWCCCFLILLSLRWKDMDWLGGAQGDEGHTPKYCGH